MFENVLSVNARNLILKISSIIKGENFYLAGGTGLALQIGHRLSEDLDFFKNSIFNENFLISNLKAKVETFEEIFLEKQTVSVFLDGVRCSFFFYDVPLCFEPLKIEGIEIARWEDILAEKFKTLSQRGSKKDFYDIFAVIKIKGLSIQEAISIFTNRFKKTALNKYHVLRSLTYFEDADEEPDPVLIGERKYQWAEVKNFFIENINEFKKALSIE